MATESSADSERERLHGRRVKAFVFEAGEGLFEYLTLEPAAQHAGIELQAELAAILDEDSTIFFVDNDGSELSHEHHKRFSHTPLRHRKAASVAGFALMETLDTRHPVLVIDAEGALYIVLSAPAERLEAYLSKRYGQRVPLLPPPENKYGRWVVSRRQGELYRMTINVAPDPTIGQA